jgi:uncharacterized protein (TIGR03000 family)
MLHKIWLAPAMLSVAGLLMSANSAFAQHGGHGGHSGGHSSGGHSSAHHSSAHHSGTHHSGAHYGGHYYHNGYYNRSYFPWYNDYTYPTYTYPSYSYYYAPSAPYYEPPIQAAPAPAADIAYIRVIAPDPQARVWFDGAATRQTGADRLFSTPSLTIGSTYSYRIRAAWMQDGREVAQERTVSVAPGQTTMVDFTR